MPEPLIAQHVLDSLGELGTALPSVGCPTHRLVAQPMTVPVHAERSRGPRYKFWPGALSRFVAQNGGSV